MFTVVGVCIPVVVDVFAIMWVVFRIKVQGFWIMSVLGVGAPHVAGGRVSGCLSGYLVFLCGVCADETPLFGLSGSGRIS